MTMMGYRAFETLAWVAGGWGAVESILRIATNETEALASAGLLTLGAAGVILVAGARRRALLLEEDLAQIEDPSGR